MRRSHLLVVPVLAAFAAIALAAEPAEGGGFGVLSLVPPLVAIALALSTKDVVLSLFLGVFGGALILSSGHPFLAFGSTVDHFILGALADEDHAAILIFTTFLGGLVGLVTKSGGTHGIVERLQGFATNPRRGQIATWVMGVVVFFDDYANTLIVGPTMRPITDRLRISREKLAYIVDSTAAPVVCLFPISTWVGFEIGLIGDAFEQLGLPYEAYPTFVASIPYRFYPIFALVLGFTIAATRIDFGPMRAAERRALDHGELLAKGAQPIADYGSKEIEPPEGIPKRAMNALIPIATVVGVTLLGLWITGGGMQERPSGMTGVDWTRQILAEANSYKALLWASLSGMIVAMVLPLAQRLLKMRDTMEAMLGGFKAMLMAFVVLILAWSLGAVCGELKTADYLVGLTEGVVSPAWLPALTFVLAAAIAFATGSSWGTLSILEPLIIPICHNLSLANGLEVGDPQYNLFLFSSIASVMAGSVWGDHCSPISDTTILSSMATGCDHIAHVRTQIPYALTAGIVGIVVGELATAYGLPAWAALLLGSAIIVGIVFGVGKKITRKETKAAPAG